MTVCLLCQKEFVFSVAECQDFCSQKCQDEVSKTLKMLFRARKKVVKEVIKSNGGPYFILEKKGETN